MFLNGLLIIHIQDMIRKIYLIQICKGSQRICIYDNFNQIFNKKVPKDIYKETNFIIKQILQMSQSGPAQKPIFQTPMRASRTNTHTQSLQKGSAPPTIEPRTLNSGNQSSSAKNQIFRSDQKQIKINISQKSNRPYVSPQMPRHQYYTTSDRKNYTTEQLLNLIQTYESQIKILQQYIHRQDLLQRQKIVQIFGFDYACCNYGNTQQSKIVLRQLSIKVKHLITENTKLKQSRAHSAQDYRPEDHLLVKQNQKLRMIIDQYKSTQNEELMRLRSQVYKLRIDVEGLNEMNRKYKNRIEALEDNARYREIKAYDMPKPSEKLRQMDNQRLRHLEKQIIERDRIIRDLQREKNTDKRITPIIPQIKPIKQDFNSIQKASSLSKQQTQFAKKQLTKQMFEFSQQLEQKNKNGISKIQDLQKRVQLLQGKLKQYEKLRNMRIDSTMRKSFMLTQSILKLKGDTEIDAPIFEEEFTFRKQQGRIRNTNKMMFKRQQGTNNQSNTPTFTKIPITPNTSNKPVPSPSNTVNQENSLRMQLKLIQQSLMMEQMKNKNINEENNMLKKKLTEAQAKTMEKIQRNIQLQALITKLQKEKEQLAAQKIVKTETKDPQIQKQIKLIRETLISCNIGNFETFFKEFNQILEQRKILADTIQQYRVATENISKSRSIAKTSKVKQQDKQQGILRQKIAELIDQNNRLIKKITDLESEVQRYHEQIISNEIQKLNQIKLNEMMNPSGQHAIEWQKKVKICIQNSVSRLQNLQKKIYVMEKQKQVQKHLKQQKIIQRKYIVQSSQYRHLDGSK